jgi:hypothetical protein
MTSDIKKPYTIEQGLANLPAALQPLTEHNRWAVWRWEQNSKGKWQKPPYQVRDPDSHASTSDPTTWATYPEAVAVVQAGDADGITYMLTAEDDLGAIDLDDCRDPNTGSIDRWAQFFLQSARHSYHEVTPSGTGLRIWGHVKGDSLNRKFTLEIEGKKVAAELFRRTNKALTITGAQINGIRRLTNIDTALIWAERWGERQKEETRKATAAANGGAVANGSGKSKHKIEDFDRMVREGPMNGENRSDLFHACVGHYLGCEWSIEQLIEFFEQNPNGVACRYIAEGRLRSEVERSASKYPRRRRSKKQKKAKEDADEKAVPPREETKPCTLDGVHAVFRKWLGEEYDIGMLDAMLAVVASEKLAGDPAWLLAISGAGNAKTETIMSVQKLGAEIISTIASEGALLSATAQKERDPSATGGLLRKIGERGILAIKDFTSILSTDSNTRTSVIAALREIYDGHWVRNVGTDGGRTLEWQGRLVVIGACTTAWDQAHGVIAAMGDRFVLVRSDSNLNRIAAGRRAILNTGTEKQMRLELAEAVAGLISQVDPDQDIELTDDERDHILRAANIVTLTRTGVEVDRKGDIIDAHAPEMPTRFAKQLSQILRGAIAIGHTREAALALVTRCARDSTPPLRLAVLEDIAAHPDSPILEVRRRLQRPRTTTDRALQALHVLGLLVCTETEELRANGVRYHRKYSLAQDVTLDALCTRKTTIGI